MSRTTSDFPGWYITFQSAVLQQLPRPDKLDKDVADNWMKNQAGMKRALAELFVPPVTPAVTDSLPILATTWANEFIAAPASEWTEKEKPTMGDIRNGGIAKGHDLCFPEDNLCLHEIYAYYEEEYTIVLVDDKPGITFVDRSDGRCFLVENGDNPFVHWHWLGGNALFVFRRRKVKK